MLNCVEVIYMSRGQASETDHDYLELERINECLLINVRVVEPISSIKFGLFVNAVKKDTWQLLLNDDLKIEGVEKMTVRLSSKMTCTGIHPTGFNLVHQRRRLSHLEHNFPKVDNNENRQTRDHYKVVMPGIPDSVIWEKKVDKAAQFEVVARPTFIAVINTDNMTVEFIHLLSAL